MSRISIALYSLFVFLGFAFTCFGISMPSSPKQDRIYFDSETVPMGEDAFHIKVGDFEWVQTTTVHRDITGFFTYTSDILKNPVTMGYERKWKCPYCNLYWPVGQPCGNDDCPSRY